MTEDDFLRALPLADQLRIAAVDLAFTSAPQALVDAVWRASEGTAIPLVKPRPRACEADSTHSRTITGVGGYGLRRPARGWALAGKSASFTAIETAAGPPQWLDHHESTRRATAYLDRRRRAVASQELTQ